MSDRTISRIPLYWVAWVVLCGGIGQVRRLMPWKPSDAEGKTHLANTARRQRMWRDVANGELERHGDDKTAIMAANAVVHRDVERHGKNEPKSEHWSGATD